VIDPAFAGLLMFAAVAVLLAATGLPAFMVLVGVAGGASAIGLATGTLSGALLGALPLRITGLLESDLLQALPLYVLMGALLNRLPLADILFRAGTSLSRSPAAPLLTAVGLGALLAPMNGSVGASAATLARVVLPRLDDGSTAPAPGLAVVCVASTLGVVVPPSLVLILLADAMMRAHTEALNATHRFARVINTQDLFLGALGPAALFLALCLGITWWTGRRGQPRDASAGPGLAGWLIAGATVAFISGLLAAVVAGVIYPVEAAATGGLVLLVLGFATGTLRREVLRLVLADTMAITGALFALFVAATTFTLVVRGLGTDRLLGHLVAAIPGGDFAATAGVLAVLGLCGIVLDAFEVIFVVIPLLAPPLLVRAPDAVWVSTLMLLALQTSFLIPPFGYAVMTARGAAPGVALRPLARALLPFVLAQMLVLGLTLAWPGLTHIAAGTPPPAPAKLSDDAVVKQFLDITPDAPPDPGADALK
jgi:TRAP-type mannitol/chloroaromatic compound transport system permease large subunit